MSPFPHQGPLEPHQVQGRDDLVADLVERLTARRVTALLGPRRFGKTSVLRRVSAELAEGGTSVVWVDLYETSSMADLARRFDTALAGAAGSVRRVLGDLALQFDLNLGFLGAQLARRREERPDPDAVFDTLLDALVSGAEETPTIVVIDEFPGIDRVEGAAGRLRTKLQHHYQQIGLAFAGSQPSLMRSLFTDRARPFFAQADLVEIGPLSRTAVAAIVADGFTETGREAGQIAALVDGFAAGHPYRTMQAADCAWRHTPPGEQATATTWRLALDSLRAETNLSCDAMFSTFTSGEKATIRLLAHGEPLFGSAAETLGLSTGSARHALTTLTDVGDVANGDDRYRIVDPVLADWVRNRFPR